MRTWYDMIKIIVGPAILVLAALTTTTTAAHAAFAFNTQFPQIQTPQIQLPLFPSLPNIFPFSAQIPETQFPNQFPFNGQPIPIHLIPLIQFPQQTQQNYPNSVSQDTQCNNGSCTTIICTNGACQTQTSTGSTVSVITQCINGICTTIFH